MFAVNILWLTSKVWYFGLPFFNLCPWAYQVSKHSQRFAGLTLANGFVHSIYNKYHHQILAMYSFKVISVIIIARLWQDTKWQNHGVKHLHVWAFCPKQWWAFRPVSRCTFFLLNERRNVGIYKWNEIEMKLRRTVLSNVKSLQILISVTQNQVVALQV